MGDGVVTLWIALDDLEPSLGPLEYARVSHLWPPPPYEGYTPSLFGKKDWRCELDKAAAYCNETVELTMVLVPRGGGSIHSGATWHGSAVNTSGRVRRGLGIHFGPVGARPQPPTSLARKIAPASEVHNAASISLDDCQGKTVALQATADARELVST